MYGGLAFQHASTFESDRENPHIGGAAFQRASALPSDFMTKIMAMDNIALSVPVRGDSKRECAEACRADGEGWKYLAKAAATSKLFRRVGTLSRRSTHV